MSRHNEITSAYAKWDAGDIDGFLDAFTDEAMFIVPGRTRVSGDHDKAAFRLVLGDIAAVTARGDHKQNLICSYDGDGGGMWLFDTHVTIDGRDDKYHSVHEWTFAGDKARVWMLYVHEYDIFERAWR